MKITVIPKELPKQSIINLQNLEPGTVVTLGNSSIKALVIDGYKKLNSNHYIVDGRKLVLFTNVDCDDWFTEPGGWSDSPIQSVIGKLTEIVIQEI